MRKAPLWLVLALGCYLLPGCQTPTVNPATVQKKSYLPPQSAGRNGQLQRSPGSRQPESALQAECYRWIGVPYRIGGETIAGADCSGFALAVYRKVFGVKLPRTTAGQFSHGTSVPAGRLREGDLVFFQTSKQAPVTHVGIYLGQGLFIHASTKLGVTISRLDEKYFAERYRGARRVLRS